MAGLKNSQMEPGTWVRYSPDDSSFKTIANDTDILSSTANRWAKGKDVVPPIGHGILALGFKQSGNQSIVSDGCVIIGSNIVNAAQSRSIYIGSNIKGNMGQSIHIGTQNANSGVPGGVGIGHNVNATGHTATAIGREATASQENSCAFGISSTAAGGSDIAFGTGSLSTTQFGIAIGAGCSQTAPNHTVFARSGATAIGLSCHAGRAYSCAIGTFTEVRKSVGGANNEGQGAFVFGHGSGSAPFKRATNTTEDSFMVAWSKFAVQANNGVDAVPSKSDRYSLWFNKDTFFRLASKPSVSLNEFNNAHSMELISTYNPTGPLGPDVDDSSGSLDLTAKWQHKITSVSVTPQSKLSYTIGADDVLNIFNKNTLADGDTSMAVLVRTGVTYAMKTIMVGAVDSAEVGRRQLTVSN